MDSIKVFNETGRDPFNFLPVDWSKKPTHRISYIYAHNVTSSAPAIFATDSEAIEAARQYLGDAKGVKVTKYAGRASNSLRDLVTVYAEGVAF